MNERLVKTLKSPRVIILIIAIIGSIALIAPNPFATGAVITGVERGSPAGLAGVSLNGRTIVTQLATPNATYDIGNALDLQSALAAVAPGTTVSFISKQGSFTVPLEVNGTNYTGQQIGVSFVSNPKTRIKEGLDLSGGTRVLIKLNKKVDDQTYSSLVDAIRQRINVYGLQDVTVRSASDLSGNQYVLVELAGISQQQVKDVVASQGKFEAKIGNETVFTGGKDITSVCRNADCSGIDPRRGCQPSSAGSGVVCSFYFQIHLTPQAAQRQADITKTIPVTTLSDGQSYLTKNLSLVLDGKQVNSLRISADLKGQATTSIAISGSGTGANQNDARKAALDNMKNLQTILQTGSLPVNISIAKIDTVSPSLGASFLRNAMLVGLLAILMVMITLVAVYRTPKLAIPISIVSLSEILIILGVAAGIGWNLDLASIAGIIVAIGTGVDDQIVITNEVLKGTRLRSSSWRQMISSAFFIILGAYATTVAAMLPLVFAGAGLLRGFALTTIIGVTIGVAITRPAFGVILEGLIEEKE